VPCQPSPEIPVTAVRDHDHCRSRTRVRELPRHARSTASAVANAACDQNVTTSTIALANVLVSPSGTLIRISSSARKYTDAAHRIDSG
jgi:hypothetical protein